MGWDGKYWSVIEMISYALWDYSLEGQETRSTWPPQGDDRFLNEAKELVDSLGSETTLEDVEHWLLSRSRRYANVDHLAEECLELVQTLPPTLT